MLYLTDLADFPPTARGGVLCVGNFDGVHVGHALMLSTARTLAAQHGVPLVIMTFDPHPNTILKPPAAPTALTTNEQKTEHLAAFDPDVLAVVRITRDFLAIPPETFLADIVQTKLGATHMVEGSNFTFGRGANGTVATLQNDGPRYGFATTIIPMVTRTLSDLTVVNVSSTLIRWLVTQGRVRDAGVCLGRAFAYRGVVVEGAKRGRTIGYPTANVRSIQVTPPAGVYGGRVVIDGTVHPAAISIGSNPTFNAETTTVEAHLLDFAGDLYGRTIDIEFTHWVREMQKFGSVAALVRQMGRDVAWIREMTSPGV